MSEKINVSPVNMHRTEKEGQNGNEQVVNTKLSPAEYLRS
jgi:hypothetical protein